MARRIALRTLVRHHVALGGALFLIGCGDIPPDQPGGAVAPRRGDLLTNPSGNMMDVNLVGGWNGQVKEMFLARSVPVLVDKNSIDANNVLKTYTINLCPGELFQGTMAITKSPLGIGCSSALVGNRLLLTANHCLYDDGLNPVSLSQYRVVFGYRRFGSSVNVAISPDDMYTPIAIVGHGADFGAGDWALLLLDRAVSFHYRRLHIGGNPAVNDSVYMLGYPIDMPEKFSTPGAVLAVDSAMFRAYLSGMAGNSGSPIFEPSGIITGILSSGPDDMEWDANLGCYHWFVDTTGAMVAKGAQTAKNALSSAIVRAAISSIQWPPPPPTVPLPRDLASGPSCAGACNGLSPDGCACDGGCSTRGDCCPDANNCSPYWTTFPTSCASSCGTYSGMCWCDAWCPTYGDCCADFFETCGRW